MTSSLPDGLSELSCNLREKLSANERPYEVVLSYHRLLRQLQKSLEKLYDPPSLTAAIRNLEIYLANPLNQNLAPKQDCSCQLI